MIDNEQRLLLPMILTVPKDEGHRNEDSYCRSFRGVHALSDGASISFDSASWSRMLVRRFVQNPDFTPEWLSGAIGEFSKLYDRDSLPWMQQAAFDQGSFASLLGVRIDDWGEVIQVLAVGDSLAVLCDGDVIKATFPYSNAAEFDKSPQLLSTNPSDNGFLRANGFDNLPIAEWSFSGLHRPSLLCMTDALGHWLLSSNDRYKSPISILRSLGTQKEFSRFVQAERASGRLRRDDTTLMAIW